jgi:ribosomal protein L40E
VEALTGMGHCPKCGVLNDVRLTRCRSCHAILPVKLQGAVADRQPARPRKAEAAGLRCARCGAVNPYSRFKCRQCGVSLTQYQPQTLRQRVLVYAGIGMLALLGLMALVRAR